MTSKQKKAMMKSCLRNLFAAIAPVLAHQLGLLGQDPKWAYACGVATALLAFSQRYFDTTDKAFGRGVS